MGLCPERKGSPRWATELKNGFQSYFRVVIARQSLLPSSHLISTASPSTSIALQTSKRMRSRVLLSMIQTYFQIFLQQRPSRDYLAYLSTSLRHPIISYARYP